MSKAKRRKEHGGSLAVNRRRADRPLNIKQSHHVTLKSHHAIGARSLFRHKKLILNLIRKNSIRFQVKVYEYAIQGNHIHLLVKAKTRESLQKFFRVVAGHSAQQILALHPLKTLTKKTNVSFGVFCCIRESSVGGESLELLLVTFKKILWNYLGSLPIKPDRAYVINPQAETEVKVEVKVFYFCTVMQRLL